MNKQAQDTLRQLEQQWERVRHLQNRTEGSVWHGSFNAARAFDIAAYIGLTFPLYFHPSSAFYRQPELLEAMQAQLAYLLRSQHPSGCISLVTCNIDSPPDTGFAVHIAALCLKLAEGSRLTEAAELASSLDLFLRRSMRCLVSGGIHTPNHRWVICGALALLYERYGGEELRMRARAYLAEGLDLNAAGEWTERSNAIYNPICDLFLFHVARVFGPKEQLLEAIRRNLTMMGWMLHPGDVVATEYSSRQDRGQRFRLSEDYSIIYRLMANVQTNPLFAGMARKAEAAMAPTGKSLLYTLVFPQLMKQPLVEEAPPEWYTVLLNEGATARVSGVQPYVRSSPHAGSPLVRHRNGLLSVTLMSGQPDFLYVQYGEARMVGMRLSLGWFGIAGVPFQQLVRKSARCFELSIVLEGTYRGPLDGKLVAGAEGNYIDMPNVLRPCTHTSQLPVSVTVELEEAEVRVAVQADQIPQLFAQLICSFDAKGSLSGDGLLREAAHIYRFERGDALFQQGNEQLVLTGGAAAHDFTCLRNDTHEPDAVHLVSNYMTPLQETVVIRFGSVIGEGKEGAHE